MSQFVDDLASHQLKLLHWSTCHHLNLKLTRYVDGKRILGSEIVSSFHFPSKQWMEHLNNSINSSAQIHTKLTKRHEEIDWKNLMNKTKLTILEQLWYFDASETLVPLIKAVDASALHQNVLYIDGDGRTISTIFMTKFDQGYVYPPTQQFSTNVEPELSQLLFVQDHGLNGGYSIQGKDFKSFNTCFAYQCANNILSGQCGMNQSMCVDVKDEMVLGTDYFIAHHNFSLDGRFIDYDRDWQAEGYQDNLVYMQWKGAPVFAPRLKKPLSNVWASDINFNEYSISNQKDSFVELQVYSLLTNHLEFMRNLLNDSNFCLIGTGPNCTLQDPHTNRTATLHDYPMPFITNYQSIRMDPKDPSHPNLFTQLDQGLGRNASFPIIFYESEDYGDAFFSSSAYQPPMNLFSSCDDGLCISVLDSPLNFFAFGQTSQSDWGLNNCIVFHEMNHAIVQKFIPDLPSYVWTANGISSEPGALNEAWADYFAAIHCQISDFTKTYNSRPNRNLDNSVTCADYVGEVHVDSLVFSGALWKIRKKVVDPIAFDRLVLHALSLATSRETFSSQFSLILRLMEQDLVLNQSLSFASAIFDERIFNCKRATLYLETMDLSFVLPPNDITVANVSTLSNPMVMHPRASDWALNLKWKQFYNSPILGRMQMGYATQSLDYIISEECPIVLNGLEGRSKCEQSLNQSALLHWNQANYQSGMASLTYSFNAVGLHSIYIQISHQLPAEMMMYSTTLTFYGFNRIWLYTIVAISCIQVLGFISILMFKFLFCIRKKPRQHNKLSPHWFIQVFSAILFCASAVASTIGLVYNPALAYVPWISFTIYPVIFMLDVTSALSWKPQHRLDGHVIMLQTCLCCSSCTLMCCALIAIPVTMSFSVSIAGHAILYAIFIVAFFMRFTCWGFIELKVVT